MGEKNAPLSADDVEPQLCEIRDNAFDDPAWLWELKLDGFRLIVEKQGPAVKLVLRRGRETGSQFPEVVAAIAGLAPEHLVLDGELVIPDAQGRPQFQALLKRSTVTGTHAIERLSREYPAAFFAFDCLAVDGEDLRGKPLRERRERLTKALEGSTRVRPVEAIEGQGAALLDLVRAQGLEGVVGKRADSKYEGGRRATWVKVPITRLDDFAVVGHAPDYGAIHLGVFDGERFVYAGKSGSGFGPKQQKAAKPKLDALRVKGPSCGGELPNEEIVFVKPELVVEIRSKRWAPGTMPREPIFLRFRDDKAPEDCIDPRAAPELPAPQAALSNPKKPYWPEDGLTKQDLFDYYRAVSPWLLPYLADRPLMLTRYPDGIHGKSFFQKSVPLKAPAWVRTVHLSTDGDTREIDQIVGADLRTLEWLANLGTIPLHLPAGRVGSLERADWCVIDLDPKGAPFANVITIAQTLKGLCEQIGLPSFPKLTGSSGLHVMLPLGAQVDHGFAVHLAEALATVLVAKLPQIATVERVIEKRAGKVYVDCYQNGHGKLIAAPLCLRPLPGAPVSMTLEWSEVVPGLTPRQFGMKTALARLEAKGDPMAPLLSTTPELAPVLEKLGRLR